MKTPILKTDRLILRPVVMEDAPAIQKYFANWEIIRHLSTSVPWPYPEDGAESFVQETLSKPEGEQYNWAITEKGGTDELIGLIDFRTKLHNDGNRGFWMAIPYQGKGYMTEAVDAVNDFVFNVLGIQSYIVSNVASNIGSRRVKEKTGAEFLGYVELAHHTGETKTEQWKVTKESWLNTSR